MSDIRADALQRFAHDTKNHTVNIRHDDGLYRHLTCSNNGSSLYRFDVVTYPGYLVVSGDIGEWVFSRLPDMFTFFRGPGGGINPEYWFAFFRGPGGGINPEYWAEKCRAGETKEFSMDKFRREVTDYVAACHEGDKETVPEELMEAIQRDIFDRVENGDDPYSCLSDFEYRFESHLPVPPVFSFHDVSEFSFSDYTFNFLWALHGIVWAINEYDQLKA